MKDDIQFRSHSGRFFLNLFITIFLMAAFLLGGLYLGARVISPSYLKADKSKLQDDSKSHIKGSSSAEAMATDRESPVWKNGVKPSDIPKWQPEVKKRKRTKLKNVKKVSHNSSGEKINPADSTTNVPDVPSEPATPPEEPTPAPPPD